MGEETLAIQKFRAKNSSDKFWSGFSKQTIDFHHALGELVDNALSATHRKRAGSGRETATIEITVEEQSSGLVRVQVADAGVGVEFAPLTGDDENIFNLGYVPSERGHLNEHGFGLKNALALMTSGFRTNFEFLTKPHGVGKIYKVRGPIAEEMSVFEASEEDWTKDLEVLRGSLSGVKIAVDVRPEYFASLYKRGRKNMDILFERLGEHLGVMYAQFISKGHEIYLRYRTKDAVDWTSRSIPAIQTPFLNNSEVVVDKRELKFELDGKEYAAIYVQGVLDQHKKNSDEVWPYPLKIYFQGSNARCGVSYIVRDRVLRTGVFREIWPQFAGDVSFNNFLGELHFSEQFTTTNNKHDMDPHSPLWDALIQKLRDEHEPDKKSKKKSEEGLRRKLIQNLKASHKLVTNPSHLKVWGAAVKLISTSRNKTNTISTRQK